MNKFLVLLLYVISFVSCSQADLSKKQIPKAEFSQSNGEITEIKGSFHVSGIYPHLTTYTHGRVNGIGDNSQVECGIGALVEWNDKLYMINYGAHNVNGSEHKLYIIDKDLNMELFQGSVGGTPAARMIHKESDQLFVGPYAIDRSGNIRVIDIEKMPGRLTAIARHLKDPENYVYYYDMEGMLYELNVHTLEPKLLFKNPLPGWHGKGAYTSQNRLVLANNGGEVKKKENVDDWKIDTTNVFGEEKRGILAEFDGDNFKVVERRQFTDVTTKNGINAVQNEQSPLWSMGWDKRAVRLKVLDNGNWETFLLPKATYNNDAEHGWFTEWPRIRELCDGKYIMDMHGMFFDFPSTFSSKSTAGIRPVSSHLRYIPDFTCWNNNVILATDETSIQGNPLAGQAQSNLWFGTYKNLSEWGPKSAYGSIWIEDKVDANSASLPFLFNGFDNRILHLTNFEDFPVEIIIEINKNGDDKWHQLKSIKLDANGYEFEIFKQKLNAEWIRLSCNTNAKLTATFHYTESTQKKDFMPNEIFEGIASTNYKGKVSHVKLYSNEQNFNLTLQKGDIVNGNFKFSETFELDKYTFEFHKGMKDSTSLIARKNKVIWEEDEASVILKTKNYRLRLPKGKGSYYPQAYRNVRELESERTLANIHGTFYEVPLYSIHQEPLYKLMRPVATHNRMIADLNTWNGLLVFDGVKENAKENKHIVRDETNGLGVWIGGIDDIWSMGKPVGEGGVWKNTAIKANEESDLYLMTGYDHKEVSLTADKDVEITILVHNTHYSDKVTVYKSFKIKANETISHTFPVGFSTHWISAKSNKDCEATVWFSYK